MIAVRFSATLDRFLNPLIKLIQNLAAFILVIMMGFTALDVGMRYFLNSPIPGGLEIIEFMMAVMVPFALVMTAYKKAHIEVDLIVEQLPIRAQRYLICITDLVAIGFFFMIAWQSMIYIGEQYQSGLTSAVLLIPHHPFVASLTLAFTLLTLISLAQFFSNLFALITEWTP